MISLKPTKFKFFIVAVFIFIAFFSSHTFDAIFKPTTGGCFTFYDKSEECKRTADEHARKYDEYYQKKSVFDGTLKIIGLPLVLIPFLFSALSSISFGLAVGAQLSEEAFAGIFYLIFFTSSLAYFYFLSSIAERAIKTYKH